MFNVGVVLGQGFFAGKHILSIIYTEAARHCIKYSVTLNFTFNANTKFKGMR